MLELYRVRGYPVLGIGHTGQVPRSVLGRATCDEPRRVFSLAEQIEHKLAVIHALVPAGSRVHLFGHSVGAYICLQLIDRLENPSSLLASPAIFQADSQSINVQSALDSRHKSNGFVKTYNIERCYLLCPTFERIAESSSGRFLTAISKFRRAFAAILALLGVLHMLVPRCLRLRALHLHLKLEDLKFRRAQRRVRASESPETAALRARYPLAFDASNRIATCVLRGCEQLFVEEWGPTRCGISMGADEMRAIGLLSERHAELLAQPRFLQLHARSDHWAPPTPTKIPGARSFMDPTSTLEHAFVFHSGAQIVHLIDMIENSFSKTNT